MDLFKTQNEGDVILVVDDNPTNLRVLQEILKSSYKVYAAPSAKRALAFLEKKIPNLILLDVEMPEMNGYELISILKQDYRWDHIPVIFLTALEGKDKEELAFHMGAVDYILKPISPGVVRSRVGLHIELESYKKNLEVMVKNKTEELQHTQDCILDMLSNVTAYRDNETGAHIKRTTIFVESIIQQLQKSTRLEYHMSEEYAQNIIKSSKLHDIGKVAVPDGILLKPDKLTSEEFEIIKQHTVLGAQILDDAMEDLGSSSMFLSAAREVVISHHERWDGTGYPYKLAGADIPISGRVMAIADVYDALISQRPYKTPMTHEQAMDIIYKSSGTHFDPNIVEICKDVFDRFPATASVYKDEHYRKQMLGNEASSQ